MSEANYESTMELGAADMGGQVEPIHVVIDNAPASEEVENTPEYGSWMTVSWAAATTAAAAAQRILPFQRKRHKAEIIVIGTPGFALVGSMKQIMNGQGAQLPAGRYPYEAAQEVWVTSDGTNAMTVAVLDQRYA